MKDLFYMTKRRGAHSRPSSGAYMRIRRNVNLLLISANTKFAGAGDQRLKINGQKMYVTRIAD